MTDTSGAAGAPPAATTPVVTPPAATTTTTTDSGKDGAHFTQAQLDAIVGDRINRERAKYSDYESLKASAADRDAAIAAAKQAGKDEASAELLVPLVESRAEAFAKALKFHNPADALATLDRDKLPIKDGKPDDEAIKAKIEQLVKEKPYLVNDSNARNRKTAPGERPKAPTGETDPDSQKPMKAAEALRALRAKSRHIS